MSVPSIESKGTVYTLTWEEEQLIVTASRIVSHTDRTTCELVFRTTTKGYQPHLFRTTFNLTSQSRGKGDLAKQLANKYDKVDEESADEIVEQICEKVLASYRVGEDADNILIPDEISDVEFKIFPLVVEGHPNMFFGDGATGKSTFCGVLVVLIQFAERWVNDNSLELRPKQGNVLYLDWEADKESVTRTIAKVYNGFGFGFKVGFMYRRCFLPFADDIETIEQICLEHKIDTILIDSITGAAGADLKVESAQRFYMALRALKCTSILIHHVSKESQRRSTGNRPQDPSPFGAAAFRNLSRNAWHVRAHQEAGSNVLELGLFHDKSNLTQKFKPIAYRLTQFKDKIDVELISIKDVPEFARSVSPKTLILEALRVGKLSTKDIADILDRSDNYARTVLGRMEKKGELIQVGKTKTGAIEWGLSYQGELINY